MGLLPPFSVGYLVKWGVSEANSQTDGSKRFICWIMLEMRMQAKLRSEVCPWRRAVWFYLFIFFLMSSELLFIYLGTFPMETQVAFTWLFPLRTKGWHEGTVWGRTHPGCMMFKVKYLPGLLFQFHFKKISVKELTSSSFVKGVDWNSEKRRQQCRKCLPLEHSVLPMLISWSRVDAWPSCRCYNVKSLESR